MPPNPYVYTCLPCAHSYSLSGGMAATLNKNPIQSNQMEIIIHKEIENLVESFPNDSLAVENESGKCLAQEQIATFLLNPWQHCLHRTSKIKDKLKMTMTSLLPNYPTAQCLLPSIKRLLSLGTDIAYGFV